MKKTLIFLMVITLLLIPFTSYADDFEKSNVPLDKEWTIKFNMELDPATITSNNIYLQDEDGRIIGSSLSILDDNKSVKLVPKDKYKPNSEYWVLISDDVRSKSGKKLKKLTTMYFTTENVVTIEPPTNVTATAVSDTEITLQWDEVEGAEYYYVYCSDSYNGEYYRLYHDNEDYKWYWQEDYSLITEELQPSTTLYYKVTAVVDGVESDSSEIAYAKTLSAFMVETLSLNIVKTGSFSDYPYTYIQNAFDNFFANPRWEYFKSDDEHVVDFNGEAVKNGQTVTVLVQFVVDIKDYSFYVYYTGDKTGDDYYVWMNNESWSALLEKIYEPHKNNTIKTLEIDSEVNSHENLDGEYSEERIIKE